MVIYTTLKANKENGVEYWDIISYTDECFTRVADLFDDSEKYVKEGSGFCDEFTDLDKLFEVYTERQVASACLKYLKTRCKGKDADMMIWNKIIFELDCDGEIAYDQVERLIKNGKITGSNQIREIMDKANRKGVSIKKGERYGENDIYFRYLYLEDLIDKYFPCDADIHGECTNCGNCQ